MQDTYNPVGARFIVRTADLSAPFPLADKSAVRRINSAPTGWVTTIISTK